LPWQGHSSLPFGAVPDSFAILLVKLGNSSNSFVLKDRRSFEQFTRRDFCRNDSDRQLKATVTYRYPARLDPTVDLSSLKERFVFSGKIHLFAIVT